MDDILARHRKELRDLTATITGMKKQATKSKRKEVVKRCQEMEENLKLKHQQELGQTQQQDEVAPEDLLKQMDLDGVAKEGDNFSNEKVPVSAPVSEPVEKTAAPKKRNRQKERLARREAAIQTMRDEAAEEADKQPDLRGMEQESISKLCEMRNLKEFDIKPDGHCLFASIADQLKERHDIDVGVDELRKLAADHIKKDPDTYTPYLFDETTMSMRDLDGYCNDIANTAMWGSDLEILALSKEFNCPISVMMSGRADLKVNEDGLNSPLVLCYYKHSFALGEHYNSLRDV